MKNTSKIATFFLRASFVDAALEFGPVERDTFQLAGVSLRFRRDKDGKVVAVDYGNPVVRNIKFTRLSDR